MENYTKLKDQIKATQARLASLEQQSAGTRNEATNEALLELGVALEELRAAQESMISQSDELAEARQNYQDLFNFAPDAYLVTDAYGVVREANRAATLLLGVAEPFILGKPLFLYVVPEARRVFRATLNKLHRTQAVQSWEIQLRPRKGSPFSASASVTSQLDRNGKLIRLLWLIRDITIQKKAVEEIVNLLEAVGQQREQLRRLTRRVAEIQEIERRELARELHDQAGQTLAGLDFNLVFIKMSLANLLPPDSAVLARLDDSLALVRQMGGAVRDVLGDLRPPVLDDHGLLAALQWYAERLSTRVNLPICVEGREPQPRLATSVENVIFRIFQEALTNVVKHAQASQVTVNLEPHDGQVRLVIADNGQGVPTRDLADPARPRSWGLLIMQERTEAVGGQFRFESSPGQGVKITAEFPC